MMDAFPEIGSSRCSSLYAVLLSPLPINWNVKDNSDFEKNAYSISVNLVINKSLKESSAIHLQKISGNTELAAPTLTVVI